VFFCAFLVFFAYLFLRFHFVFQKTVKTGNFKRFWDGTLVLKESDRYSYIIFACGNKEWFSGANLMHHIIKDFVKSTPADSNAI
jgi:hypothetical protein